MISYGLFKKGFEYAKFRAAHPHIPNDVLLDSEKRLTHLDGKAKSSIDISNLLPFDGEAGTRVETARGTQEGHFCVTVRLSFRYDLLAGPSMSVGGE